MELQELDRNMLTYLQLLQEKNVLNPVEINIVSAYFLAGIQLTPNHEGIRMAFYESKVSPELFEDYVSKASIPAEIRRVVLDAYNKTHEHL